MTYNKKAKPAPESTATNFMGLEPARKPSSQLSLLAFS
jgi:hypothetical protein